MQINRLFARVTCTLVLMLWTAPAFSAVTEAEDLLNFFSSTCSTGVWTQTAINQATALKKTLEEMNSVKGCESLSSESININAINNSLVALSDMKNNSLNSISLLSQEQALLSSLAYTTKPADVKSLQDLLARMSNQFNSVNETNKLAARTRAAGLLISATNDLVNQTINNQKCLLKKPGLLATIGSLVANVGAAVTAVNPGLGLGVAAGGSMLSNLVNLAHKKQLTRAVRRLNNDVLKPEAFACVMESLTNDFCRAQEAIVAINWQQKHQLRNVVPITEPLYGLDLLSRELPNLLRWLQTLKSSAAAQNPIDAYRIQDFNEKEAIFNSSPQIASGVLNQTKYSDPLIAASSITQKWPIIRSMIKELAGQLYGGSHSSNSGSYNGSSSSPLFQKKTFNEAMFYLVGVEPVPRNPKTGALSEFSSDFDPEIYKITILASIDDFKKQFSVWYDDTKADLDQERTTIHQPDMAGALEAAFETAQDYQRGGSNGSANQSNDSIVSPYQSLENIITYLDNQLLSNPGQYESRFYLPGTIAILKSIRTDLESIHLPKPDPRIKSEKKFYEEVLSDIYKLAALDFGTVFLQGRVSKHVDNAIVRYISDPKNSTDVAPILAQTLFSAHMTDVLKKNAKDGSLGAAKADIAESTTVSYSTFQVFVESYQADIANTLTYLQDQEQQTGEVMGWGYKQKRSKICSLLVNMAEWPAGIPFDVCAGTNYSLITDVSTAPKTPVLTPELIQTKLDDRACQYYKFKRDQIIFEL